MDPDLIKDLRQFLHFFVNSLLNLFEALLVHFYNFVNIMKNFLMIQLDDLATKEENTNESQPRGEDDSNSSPT